MNTRALFRWTLSIVVALGLLGVIGLALNSPAQARSTTAYDWPGQSPCDASLQQCIDAATVLPGDVIHIRPGVYTQSVTLAKPVSLIGDDSASTILLALKSQRVLTVTGSLTFTTIISGLTFAGGELDDSSCPSGCGGGILLMGAARPELQNIALVANTAHQGGGLWVDGGPQLKLTNVSFISNTARNSGGGLYVLPDAQLINNDFERDVSSLSGGGVYALGAIGLSGGRFISNQANSGGGLYASAMSMVNTEFSDNQANGGSGGGIYLNGQGQLTGGLFQRNSSQGFGNGGGLYAMGLNAYGTVFISNTASSISAAGQGGGAYLSSNSSTLDNVSFIANTGTQGGGGLYAGMPSLTLNAVSFVGNNSTNGSGGGLQAQNAQVQGGVFDQNTSGGLGGGAAVFNNLSLSGVRLTNNTSGNNGGGVYAGGTMWITNTLFIKNTASNGGGLYQTPAGDAHIVNTLFARNQSTLNQAAAIAFAATGSLSMVHSTIVDNVLNPASAVVIDNGNGAADIRDTIITGHAVGINLLSGGTFEDYNLYFNTTSNISGSVTIGGNSIPNADPQFADPSSDDYHLRFTSPAINAGINVGVNFDIDGQPRPIGPGFDIGFDEAGSSIQQLIDATPPGGTVMIPAGVYLESLNLYKPVSLIGPVNGAAIIQALPGDRVLTVTGPITSSTQIVNVILEGGSLIGGGFERAGGGVLITGTAYPVFNNVQIIGNGADFGGGLYVYSGGAVLSSTLVMNNNATQSGGGAYVVEPTAELEQIGGVIANNTAADGAGVFVQSGQFQQSGGLIFNNVASNWGGGLLIGSGGSIRLSAGQIMSNSAQNAGGGLLVDVGTAEVLNSQIVGNSADEGGGLYVRNMTGTSVVLNGGKVESNSAIRYGGGAYAIGPLSITGTKFFNNSAYDGSALEITGTAQARVVNAFIAGNPANGAFPSTNSSVRFDSNANSVIFHTTFGNPAQPLTRALAVNSGFVTVANTIVASYTNGLSWFGGRLAEDYNLFFGTSITASGSIGYGGHSLVGLDPQFKGAAVGDYHIKGLSPAVNRGTNVGVRRDIDLDARPLGGGFDIGADEASVAGATPGPNIGGSFTYTTMQNSTINVNVPPGAVTQTVPIYCSLIDPTLVPPPHSLQFAGVVFELDADLDPTNVLPGSISFNMPVTLSVSYTDQQLAAAGITDELSLKLYRFEPLVNDWRPIGFRSGETQTLDADNNIITATVLGFSRFGGMGRVTAGFDIFLPLVMKN
ncbi:MAG TPA: choice-of-anchor Q domain-containing protein [Anaerolineae bacterium]|nr:choice-of-anchor Q domain-containing protein [Anaerolineae bacterium]